MQRGGQAGADDNSSAASGAANTTAPSSSEARAAGGLGTRLTHLARPSTRDGPGGQQKCFINPPLVRGSTVAFPSVKHRQEAWGKRYESHELVYGIVGTQTHFALEDVVADIEGGVRCQVTSSGLSACTIALMAFLKAGDHCLIPDAVYGPVRSFANHVLRRYGVEVTFYDPEATAAELETLFTSQTKVLYVESPGSHTFEVVDVAAYSDMAHRHGAKVLLDNTWGVHYFQPFTTGKVDVSIQALTKYVIGHSDALLGAIVVKDEGPDWKCVRDMALSLGDVSSPSDCWLALRGVRTLAVRLEHQMKAGLEVATFMSRQPEVLRVLHPALPSHPGHELFKRDYSGCCSLFGVVFLPRFSVSCVWCMLESYRLFTIGASWGGFESLVLPTTGGIVRETTTPKQGGGGGGDYRVKLGGPTARYHIGLEEVADLIEDLRHGLEAMRRQRQQEEEEGGGAG